MGNNSSGSRGGAGGDAAGAPADQTELGGTNEDGEYQNRDRPVDGDEPGVGEVVEDADDANPNAAVVVGNPDEDADEYEVTDDGQTVADFNDDHPEDDDVVEIAFADELESEIPDWQEMSPEELAAAIEDADLNQYAYPESRIADSELNPDTNLPDGFGAEDLGDVVEEMGYEEMVDEMTNDPPGDLSPRQGDVEEFKRDLEQLGTEQMPGEDETRIESLIEEYDEYDSPEDVIREARQAKDQPWVESAPAQQHMDSDYDDVKDWAHGRWEQVDAGDIADKDAVVISDSTDTDGSTSMMLYEEEFGDDAAVLPSGHKDWQEENGENVNEGIGRVLQNADEGTDVYIADLNPEDTEEFVQTIEEHGGDNEIYVRDHHEWDSAAVSAVEEANRAAGVDDPGENHVIVDGDAPAAAGIVHENDVDEGSLESSVDGVSDDEFRENIREAVEMTELVDSRQDGADNWDDASVYRSLQYHYDHEGYTETVKSHGADVRTESEKAKAITHVNTIEEIQSAMTAETRRSFSVDAGGEEVDVEVRMADYVDRGRVADRAHDRGADVVGVVTGGSGDQLDDGRVKVSFRSTEEYPVATDLANEFGGGGREDGMAGGSEDFDVEPALGNVSEGDRWKAHNYSGGEPVLDLAEERIPDALDDALDDSSGE